MDFLVFIALALLIGIAGVPLLEAFEVWRQRR